MNYANFEPTHPLVVEDIKEIIKDKVVYDIGAGYGDFAQAMARYAKKTVAVEMDYKLATEARNKKVEVINDNFLNIDFSEAEVIYIFMGFMGLYALSRKIEEEGWTGIVISHYYPLQDLQLRPMKPDKIIHANYDNVRFPLLVYAINPK